MENYYLASKNLINYTPYKETLTESYKELGLMCGLEVHQQLKTEKKLFCHCPAGKFQKMDQFQAEITRHMRPTLSEMGGYDGTALMEFKTKKTIIYRIADETTCTYEIDDTPPFKINNQALNIALEIAQLLKSNIVGELHITRKQYLDGSIPTGFQRTAIVSIEGEIPLKSKTVRIIQLSIEEDSCREVSDVGHVRVYTTDRLGMPLIETVTYPELETPFEAAEAAQYIRFLNRSTGKVRTGIGAAREDVNVSIAGGTRVEIKGVSRISSIPELVHNEAFRQKSLLKIKKLLNERLPNKETWKISYKTLTEEELQTLGIINSSKKNLEYTALNLPYFKEILSFFTGPGRRFSDEISDRLKVIACIEKPNMLHSEDWEENIKGITFEKIRNLLKSQPQDSQIILWGPKEDIPTALATIEERCLMAFEEVPKETRKALENGTTLFERVLPGADRMYPDTDSAPISISEDLIKDIGADIPKEVSYRLHQLRLWQIPEDTYFYLLRNNLVPLIEKINLDFKISPLMVGTLLGHKLKHLEGNASQSFVNAKTSKAFNYNKIYDLYKFITQEELHYDIAYDLLPEIYKNDKVEISFLLQNINFEKYGKENIVKEILALKDSFMKINTSKNPQAIVKWIMKELHSKAVGNIPLKELAEIVEKEMALNE